MTIFRVDNSVQPILLGAPAADIKACSTLGTLFFLAEAFTRPAYDAHPWRTGFDQPRRPLPEDVQVEIEEPRCRLPQEYR